MYRTPFSLMKIFCISTFLCNFLVISLQYASFFCNSCNCPGFSGSLISLTSSCSVTLMQKSICELRKSSPGSLSSRRFGFFKGCSLNFQFEYAYTISVPRVLRVIAKFAVLCLRFCLLHETFCYFCVTFIFLS